MSRATKAIAGGTDRAYIGREGEDEMATFDVVPMVTCMECKARVPRTLTQGVFEHYLCHTCAQLHEIVSLVVSPMVQ